MPAASILIKPASANCNINCEYCFYKCLSSNREEYSKGFMSDDTLEQLVKNAMDYADGYVSFAFQGGEPTLAGIDFFQKALELQKKYNTKNLTVENTIQTNGMLINEEWASFLAKHHFLVGLSLDGPRKMHDQYRKDLSDKGTFTKIMETISLFDKYHVEYNILTVVTKQTCESASYLYKFYKKHGFSYIQLIPCMDEKKRQDKKDKEWHPDKDGQYAVIPEKYGHFLCELFDLWYEDFCKGEKMDIRMFSNLAQMAAGYPAEECGMNGRCDIYFVVEGDGSVYPCDFYCMDDWKLGEVSTSFKELKTSEKANQFVQVSHELPETCKQCAHLSLCRVGCRRWREDTYGKEPGINYLCQAYEIFFNYTKERIDKLGQIILNHYGEYHAN